MDQKYPTIKTVDALRSFMTTVEGEKVIDGDLIWFVCFQNARLLLDSAGTKDVARMFSDGMAPINQLSHVQEFIDTFQACEGETEMYNTLPLVAMVFNFYSKYTEEEEVDALISDLEKEMY
jgi:hypothetical protein